MHELPHLAPFARGPLPVSARLARAGINLPTYVALEPADVRIIGDAVVDSLEEHAAG